MRARIVRATPLLVAYAAITVLMLAALSSYQLVWVAGASMYPSLRPGDVVIVAKRTPVRRGDIALLKPGAGYVLHRVVRTLPDGGVAARGDANPVCDLNPTPRGAVHGRVVRVVPFGAVLERWRSGSSCDTLPAQSDSARL